MRQDNPTQEKDLQEKDLFEKIKVKISKVQNGYILKCGSEIFIAQDFAKVIDIQQRYFDEI